MNSKWVQNYYGVAFHMLSDLALMRLQKGHNFGYSGLSNNRIVWNKRTGQGISPKINKHTVLFTAME